MESGSFLQAISGQVIVVVKAFLDNHTITNAKLGDLRAYSSNDTGCFVAKLGLVAPWNNLHSYKDILS